MKYYIEFQWDEYGRNFRAAQKYSEERKKKFDEKNRLKKLLNELKFEIKELNQGK